MRWRCKTGASDCRTTARQSKHPWIQYHLLNPALGYKIVSFSVKNVCSACIVLLYSHGVLFIHFRCPFNVTRNMNTGFTADKPHPETIFCAKPHITILGSDSVRSTMVFFQYMYNTPQNYTGWQGTKQDKSQKQ